MILGRVVGRVVGRVLTLLPSAIMLGFFVTLIYFAIPLYLVADCNLVSEIAEIQTDFTETFRILEEVLSQ